jgi:glycerophosphoryl diester phosphodiesterase
MSFAHRGGELEMPGERMESFRRAAALGVDALELDVRLSADGVLVVCHDPTVDRTTNGSGRVCDLRASRLVELDGGWWWPHQDEPGRASLPDGAFPWRGKGLRIALLEEIFRELADMRMNIDCKDHREQAIAALAEMIRRYDRVDRTLVASFSHRTVTRCRALLPGAATAASPREAAAFLLLTALGLWRLSRPSFQGLQIPSRLGRLRLLRPRTVRAAHVMGMHLTAWTINEQEQIQQLLSMGVDGIVTDRPSLLLRVLGAREKGGLCGTRCLQ